MVRLWILVSVMVCAGRVAQAQLVLDEAAVRKNLVHEVAPVAPGGASSHGHVVLLVEIAADGRVREAKVDTGPSSLRGPAVDAVKDWRFRPFLSHGEKVAVRTKLTVSFGEEAAAPAAAAAMAARKDSVNVAAPVPGKLEDATARAYFPLADECHKLVLARADAAAEAKSCRAAAAVAKKFGPGTRFVERRSAYVYAATALMRTDELKDAMAFGTRAIAVVAEGHDDDSGSSAAYAVRGQAEAFAGQLEASDRDLAVAEDFERKALAGEAGKDHDAQYRAAMKSLLLFHAQLLKSMGRQGGAADKTAEAAKL